MSLSIFDADSHVMETEDWLPSFGEPGVRERLGTLGLDKAGGRAKELMDSLPGVWAGQRDEEIGPDVISGPKGWLAPGALDAAVRSRVLDALGISAQLVFPTFSLTHFSSSKDLDVLYGGTRALNRAMAAFCEPDPRLKAVGFLPLADPGLAVKALDEAIELGVAAVWLPSEAPGDFSPAHIDLDPVWARLAEAGIPFVLHVGGGKLLPRAFHNNGLPRPTDWLGGGENLRAKDFPVVHHSPERFLACLVLDGVFERHPSLRGGAIELGASWVPSFLRNIDHACKNFSKFEPLLAGLSLKPSEYVRRQLKFTPFAFEDTTWLIEQAGPELFMFSTDYPHPEGGRHPFEIFGGALSGFPEEVQQRFFWGNGAELLGIG
jgi:predicted TIM-barrel fold metal-dependent hydrolase